MFKCQCKTVPFFFPLFLSTALEIAKELRGIASLNMDETQVKTMQNLVQDLVSHMPYEVQ